MEQQSKEALERQIKTEIENLALLETGKEEKTRAVSDLSELCQIIREDEKASADYQIKMKELIQQRNESFNENSIRHDEIRSKFFESIIGHAVTGIGIGASLAFSAYWMKQGFKFEETGTFTSQTFRTLWSGFVKKFK